MGDGSGLRAAERGKHGIGIHLNREGNSGTVMVTEEPDGQVTVEVRGDAATLVLVTHMASDAALAKTVEQISSMGFIRRAASVMRVEGMPSE